MSSSTEQDNASQMEMTAEYGRHLFCRGVDLDLYKTLEALPSSIRYLHLYCVNLDYSRDTDDGSVRIQIPQASELRYIHIFACTFLNRTGVLNFKIISPNKLKIDIYFETVPRGLMWIGPDSQTVNISREDARFNIKTPTASGSSGTTKEELTAEFHNQLKVAESMHQTRNMAGLRINYSPRDATFEPLSRISAGEFARSGLVTFANDTAQRARNALGNLPFLLNHVFALACSLVFQGLSASDVRSKDNAEQKAMEYLSFIRRSTSSCPEFSALQQDASTLLQRFEVARRYPGPFKTQEVVGKYVVPLESCSKYENHLQEAISSCKDVQNSLNSLLLATNMAQELKRDNAKALDALSSLALGTIPDDQYYKAMNTSFEMVDKCKNAMKERQGHLISAETMFKDNFKIYQQEKKDERDMAMWMGAGEIAVQLVIALCTDPVVAIPTIVEITATVTEAVQQANKEASKDLHGKHKAETTKDEIAPEHESKASDVAKSVGESAMSAGNSMVQAWQAYNNNLAIRDQAEDIRRKSLNSDLSAAAGAASDIITASSPPMDYFGLLSDWEEIKVQVKELFNVLKFKLGSDTIEGLEEYQSALSNMIIRGKTLIEAQRQLQEDLRSYLRGIAESSIRAKREAEIKKAAQDIAAGTLPTSKHIDDLSASLVVLKRAAVLRLHQYLLRLRYLSSRYNDIRVNASPEMSVEQLETVKRNLASQVEERGTGTQNKQDLPLIEFSTNDDQDCNVFVSGWKTWLRELKQIPFEISYKNPAGDRYYDLRVAKISAQFIRKDGRPFTKVNYDISIGPVLIDRDSEGKLYHYYADEFLLRKIDSEGEWVSASQTESDARILPALFTSGIIDLGRTNLRNITLEEVAEIKLEISARGIPY
ncbi:hypothetical protein FSARC_13130 [Fusarium sarcochroum]|uniref:Uncharacterized protein n=1 Tax=Fusarium sarcochroum TaxID=1208366 RepID=A0A8H4T3D6_9HYPO|nr:hypothetical protein FSARC_13130 [Fusarium sarcochroum]